MKKVDIILGLGFGDEGKGCEVSKCCLDEQYKNKVVVRFNGGHQVGHTVVYDNHRHIFSNFGSGTLQDVPTYWSKYCTIHPLGFYNEYVTLYMHKFNPKIYVDKFCPITTPYEIIFNKYNISNSKHGTCGIGFGATIERQENMHSIHAIDLLYPEILKHKIDLLKKYYNSKISELNISTTSFNKEVEKRLQEFYNHVNFIKTIMIIIDEKDIFNMKFDHFIFEGAQGILLDKNYGFFPHVTRSNTTSKNIIDILNRNKINSCKIDIHYITRSYQTRHGSGPMTDYTKDVLKNFKTNIIVNDETNKTNQFQGDFRIAPLDLNLIDYALNCDSQFHTNRWVVKTIVVTCLDQFKDNSICYYDDITLTTNVDKSQFKNSIEHKFSNYTIRFRKSEKTFSV